MTKAAPVPRLFALALTLALTVAVLGGVSPAAAAPGTPTNLAPSGPISSNTPTLSWTKSSGGVKYEVQVDDDSGFGSPLFTSTTTNNRSVPDKVLPAGDVFWRVRAIDASNNQSSWAVESIVVAPTTVPTPVSPVGGDPLQQPNEPPLLTWTAVQGATSYQVQVDETDLFTSPMVDLTTQTTSTVVPDPLAEGEYFWRVKATKAAGADSLFSDPASFVIVPQAAPVTLGSGLPTENAVEDVELSWNPVPGAAYYQLQVALDADFNNIIDDKSLLSSKVFGTHYSPAVTYDNNQYFWRVRAVDAGGNRLAWSTTRQFTRSWPDTPQPLTPLGAIGNPTHVTSLPSFQWTPVQHASHYELQLGTDVNFSPATYSTCQTALTTFTPSGFEINHNTGGTSDISCDVAPGTVYYWRVRPLDRPFTLPGVEGLYSTTQSFVYDDADVFSSFDPTGGETVDIPILSWVPIKKATRYVVSIKDNFNATVVNNKPTYSTSYTPILGSKLDPAKGPFTWSVYAEGADGKPLSRIYNNTFNVSGNLPTYGDAPLTLQPTAAGALPPNLKWEPYPGADHYRIFAGVHGSGTFWTDGASSSDAIGLDLPYPAVTDTWTWFLDPGQYDWYVQAYNASNATLGTSSLGTFTITQLAPVTGQSIALDALTLNAGNGCDLSVNDVPDICSNVPATPVLNWNPVPGASFYIVYLSEDSSFTNLVEPLTALGATNTTRWAPTMAAQHPALPDSNASTAYHWFVRPCKSKTQCGPSPVSTTGMATNKFRKTSPAVVLTSPGADSPTVTTSDIRFDWVDYFDTNQATTWSLTGEESPQAAKSYRIQVDDDPAFGSPIETAVVDQSVYTAPTRLYPDGELYWRVQAIDADDNGLTWSTPARLFTKATTKPVLTSPLNQTVGGTTAFRWQAMTSLGSYQLEVYKNGDTAATPANRLFGSTITAKQSGFVFTKPIPASTEPYVWRVRRVDAYSTNNKGPWSNWGTFHSSGSAPTLLAPAAGAYQPASGPLFTWSDVPGATTYQLEVKNASSGSNLSGTPKTTPASAWAATTTVADGIWEWRVTAKDSAGAVLGTSAWRAFQVDGTRPTVVSKSPTGTVSRSTNFKAKFSEKVVNVSGTTMKLYLSGTTTQIQATVTLSSDGKVATLNPEVNLAAGRSYTVKLTSGIKDLAGNKLVATSWKVKAQ